MGYSDQATSAPARPPGPRTDARSYDFRRPVRLTREDSHVLKVAMQTFGRQTTTVLTTGLRALSHLSLLHVEEMTYDEFLTGIGEHDISAVLSMEPLQGKALLTTSQPAMLAMVDHMLGGQGGEKQPERPLTEIEQTLVKHQFVRVLRELAYAMEAIAETNPTLTALETNPQFVQAAAATDPVVVIRLQLTVGDVVTPLDLCFPYTMLAPALAAINHDEEVAEREQLRRAAAARTSQRLNDVEVDVTVRFDVQHLPSSEIGRLKVGDVLNLGHRTSRPLAIMSGGSVFAMAVPGTSGKFLAALIVDGH